MQFSKMHGLGNDFVVVDAVTQNAYFTPETIKRLADRHRGIGFDQLLIVEPPYDPDLDFHYRIFNADGSEVSQCGNGARCFARFVTLKGLTNKKDIAVSTQKGKMVLTVKEDGQIRVNMGEPIWEPNKIPLLPINLKKIIFCVPMFKQCFVVRYQWAIHIALFKWTILKRPMLQS